MTESAWTVRNMKRIPTKNWIERTCLYCNKMFFAPPNQVKKGFAKYCSRICSSIKNGLQKGIDNNGENNPNWKGGLTKNRYAYKLRDKQGYPEKHKARDIVRRAKKSGKLIPKPCFICGEINVHAHHEDYFNPLDVKWMCAQCHHKEHHKKFRHSVK